MSNSFQQCVCFRTGQDRTEVYCQTYGPSQPQLHVANRAPEASHHHVFRHCTWESSRALYSIFLMAISTPYPAKCSLSPVPSRLHGPSCGHPSSSIGRTAYVKGTPPAMAQVNRKRSWAKGKVNWEGGGGGGGAGRQGKVQRVPGRLQGIHQETCFSSSDLTASVMGWVPDTWRGQWRGAWGNGKGTG